MSKSRVEVLTEIANSEEVRGRARGRAMEQYIGQ